MSNISLIVGAGTVAIISFLIVLIRIKSKKIEKLKSELTAKDIKIAGQTAQIAEAKAKIQEVLNVQKDLKDIDSKAQAPEKVDSPASGDADTRIIRFSKL